MGFTGKTVSYTDLKTGQLTVIQNKQTAWQSLNTRFLALLEKAAQAQQDENWIFRTSQLSTDALSVETDATAVPGTYKVGVDRLARFHRISSDLFPDLYGSLGLNGTLVVDSLEVPVTTDDSVLDIAKYFTAINNATVVSDEQDPAYISAGGRVGINNQEITIPAGADLAEIRDLINANPLTGAWAAVSGNRLYLGASDGSAVTVGDASGTVLSGLNMLNPDNQRAEPLPEDVSATVMGSRLVLARQQSIARLELGGDQALWQSLGILDDAGSVKNEIAAPQTAFVQVDGQIYERGTNTITDILEGLTLTLHQTSDIAQRLTIAEDNVTPLALIEDFVEQYNLTVTEINGLLSDDGLFRMSATVWGIRDEMIGSFKEPVGGADPSLDTATAAGLVFEDKPASVITGFSAVRSDALTATSPDEPFVRIKGEQDILNRLSDIGIIYDETWGTLHIDRERLISALDTEPEATKDLFTVGTEGLARRVRAHMERLVDTPVGTVAGQMAVLELAQERIESADTQDSAGIVYAADTKTTYLSLLYIQNLLVSQRESYLNTNTYDLFK